jgi:FkbM family methyltransferase
MNRLKELVRKMIRSTGYDLVPYKRTSRGKDRFLDIQYFLNGRRDPLILDVGGNIGQSIIQFKARFPDATIHSFEPGGPAFAILQQNAAKMRWPNVYLHNLAMGAAPGTLTFEENEQSVLSSFLPPDNLGRPTVRAYPVTVSTVDGFADARHISFVHVLKSDTQGFELEVFKGAQNLFAQDRVGLILCECIVSNQYRGLPRLDTLLGFLADRGFLIAGVYDIRYQRGRLGWFDLLAVNERFYRQRVQDQARVSDPQTTASSSPATGARRAGDPVVDGSDPQFVQPET